MWWRRCSKRQVIYGIEPSGDLKILPGVEGEGKRLFAGYDGSDNFLGVVFEASGMPLAASSPASAEATDNSRTSNPRMLMSS